MRKNGFVVIMIFFGSISAWCQTRTLDIGIDTDDDPTTGCTWNLADGTSVEGIEGILRTTYSTGASPQVLETAYLRCSDGNPSLVSTLTSFPWPIGLNLGPNGEDIIESSIPLDYLGITGRIRMVVETRSNTEFDQLRIALGGDPIVFTFPIPLPTLHTTALILFIFLLLVTSIWFMRRHRKRAFHVLIILSSLCMLAMTCSILLDGQVDDWSGMTSLTEDPAGDTPDPTLDITSFFACQGERNLYFRIDVSEAENQGPTAEDEAVNLLEDSQLLITLTATDPDGQALDFEIVGSPSQGSLSAIAVTGNETAEVTYTPNSDHFGADSFSFRAYDGFSYSSPATVSIQVDPVNDEPSFTSGGDVTVQEDAGPQKQSEPRRLSWANNLSPGPSNEAGQLLTFQMTGNTNSTLFAVQPTVDGLTGELSFTPADNEFGSSDMTLHLMDDGGTANGGDDSSPSVTFTITVTSQNDDPTANDDSVTVDEDSIDNVLDVLANDTTDPDVGETLSITTVGTPDQGGMVSIDSGINLLYSPLADFFGTESFTYTISDGNGGSDTATVTVTVENINDDPTAIDDSFSVNEDSIDNPLDPLTNDVIDPDTGETLTINAVGTPDQGGSVSISGGNSLLYSPAADFFGTESLTYDIDDGNGGADSGTITITVNNVNDDPTANDDSFSVNEDSSANALDLLTNDAQTPDSGETLTINAVGTPDQGGIVVITGGGTGVSYSPAADFNGQETFTYDISDGNGGTDSATVTVDIQPVNDVPSFTSGADPTVLEDAGPQSIPSWATGISSGPIDESGQALTFNITSNTNSALFTTQPSIDSSGTLSFETTADANGSSNITITLSDDGGTANGGLDTSPSQTFTINVTAVNDAPSFTSGGNVAFTGTASPQTESGWATAITAGPGDESGQVLTFNVTGNTNPSLFSTAPAVNAVSGDLTYTPVNGASGTATLTLTLSDDAGTANGGVDTSPGITFDIQITAQNQEPSFTAGADETVLEDAGAQTINGWATNIDDGDGGGQTLTFTINNDNNALFDVQPDVDETTGTLTYTPAADANGVANVSIFLTDDGGTAGGGDDQSPTANFTITVTSVNDVPVFTAGADEVVLEDAGPQSILNWATGISAGPTNESGQTLTFNIASNTNPGLFAAGPAIDSSGNLTYTTTANASGSATITVTLSDDGGTADGGVDTSAAQSFDITVTAVNDPPVAGADTAFDTAGHMALYVDVAAPSFPHFRVLTTGGTGLLENDSDPVEGQTISITAINGVNSNVGIPTATTQGGSVTVSATGTMIYNPPPAIKNTTDTFTYTITDSGGASDTATVFIEISNDMVWFLDDTAAGGGNGTSATPFNNIGAYETARVGGSVSAADWLFVYRGNTGTTPLDGSIQLLDNMRLIGEEVGLSLTNPNTAASEVLIAAGSRPQISVTAGGSDAIIAADNVTIQGFDITGATDDGISLNDVTGVVIEDVSVNNISGHGIEATGPQAGVTLRNFDVTGTNGDGINIDGITTGLTILLTGNPSSASELNNAGDDAISITNVTGNSTVTIDNSGGNGVSVDAATAAALRMQLAATSTATVSNLTVTNSVAGVVSTTGASGNLTYSFDNCSIGATTGRAVDLSNAEGTTSATFALTNMAYTSSFGDALSVNGTGGLSSTINGLSFASTVAAGGDGLAFTGVDFDSDLTLAGAQLVAAGNVTIGTAGSPIGGQGINISNSTGNLGFGTLNINSNAGGGLRATAAGTLNLANTAGTIAVSGGPAVSLDSVTTALSFTSLSSTNSTTDGITATGISGTFTVTGPTTINHSGAADGIDISASTSATFSFNDLSVITSAGTGIRADGAGTFYINGATNTIAATGGAAVNINNTVTGMTFQTLGATNSTLQGIDLTSLGNSSSFAVTGTTTINGTTNEGIRIDTTGTNADIDFATLNIDNRGSTGILLDSIQGDVDFGATTIPNQSNAGGYGIRCDNTSATVTFASTTISAANETVAEIDPGNDLLPDNEGDGDGIFLSGNSGTFTINGGSISNVDGDAIDARSLTAGLNVTGMTITAPGQHGFRGILMTGTHTFTNSVFTQVNNANAHGALMLNTNQTLDGITFDNCDFHTSTTLASFVFMATRGTGNMTLNVQNGSEFFGLAGEALQTTAGDDTGVSGDINTNISNSTFRDAAGATGANSIFIGSAETNATNTVNIDANTFSNVKVSTTPLGNESVVRFQTNGGALNGTISNNTIHNTNGRRNGLGIVSEPPVGKTASVDLIIDGNDIDDIDAFQFEGIFISLRDRTTDSEISLINNNVGQKPGSEGDVDRGIFIQTRDNSGVAPFTLYLLMHNNIFYMDSSATDDVVGVDCEDDTTISMTVTSNTFTHSNASAQCFDAEAENTASTICLNMNATGAGATQNTANREIEVERDNGATYRIEGLGADSAAAAVAAFLNGNNSFTGTITALDDGGLFLDSAGCPSP